jgi:hypothetical protein
VRRQVWVVGAAVAIAVAMVQAGTATASALPRDSANLGTAPIGPTAANVYVRYPSVNGVTSMAVYLPAPGVSANQLASMLLSQGMDAFVAGGDVSPLTSGCGYGTATALDDICPPLHWTRGGFANPQIYYHDQSSSAWPEGTAITKWNSSPNIHVAWYPNGCPGTSGTHCVYVVDGQYGDSGWTGQTTYRYNTLTHEFIDGSVYIHFNNYYALTAAEHLQVACHETGHSFGMGHNSSLNSCLYAFTTISVSNVPDGDDYLEILNKIYPK